MLWYYVTIFASNNVLISNIVTVKSVSNDVNCVAGVKSIDVENHFNSH